MLCVKASMDELLSIRSVLEVMKVGLKRQLSPRIADTDTAIVPYSADASSSSHETSCDAISSNLKALRTMNMEFEAGLVYEQDDLGKNFVF